MNVEEAIKVLDNIVDKENLWKNKVATTFKDFQVETEETKTPDRNIYWELK